MLFKNKRSPFSFSSLRGKERCFIYLFKICASTLEFFFLFGCLASFSFSFSGGERAVLYLFVKHLFFHFFNCFLFGLSLFAWPHSPSLSPGGERAMLYLFVKHLLFHFFICFLFGLPLLAWPHSPSLSSGGERAMLYLFVKHLFFHFFNCFLFNKTAL